MKELMKVVRLAFYVCALPLVITAVASAHNLFVTDDLSEPLTLDLVEATDALAADRAHVLAADTAGNLTGRVIQFENAAEGLQVYFVRNGEIEQSVVTDAQGYFDVSGLTAGPYSFVAAGKNGLVAHGVYVTTDAEQGVSMETAAVAPSFETVSTFISENTVPQSNVIENVSVNELEIAEITGGNRIQLTAEGTLVGRVVALQHMRNQEQSYTSTRVQLINSQQEVREVFIEADGTFSVANVEPGVYDFVAAGNQGFAAVSFEAIAEEDAPAAAPTQNASFATQDPCCHA